MFTRLRYFFEQLEFLKVYVSPFVRPKIKFYWGELQFGVPYFYPRVWKKNKSEPGHSTAVPKRIGFDFVGLGWKTKYGDYRHEWDPLISFVFFKWQFCMFFIVPGESHYWESWLYYEKSTDKDKSKEERIRQCIEGFPNIWTRSCVGGGKETINYYTIVLKESEKFL